MVELSGVQIMVVRNLIKDKISSLEKGLDYTESEVKVSTRRTKKIIQFENLLNSGWYQSEIKFHTHLLTKIK